MIDESLRKASIALKYRIRRLRADGEQKKALPSSYSEYRAYKKRYGVSPGDIAVISERPCVILSIEGPPSMVAKVEYLDLWENQEYTTGLANVLRASENRKV